MIVQDDAFTLATPAEGDWLILQSKASADAKAVTARVHYNITKCESCSNPEVALCLQRKQVTSS